MEAQIILSAPTFKRLYSTAIDRRTNSQILSSKDSISASPWRTLYSGSTDVGSFRLKKGTDYLKRELEFRPLTPIPLTESHLGKYLLRELHDCNVVLDDLGGISVRLGPNRNLGPISGKIAFIYKLMQPSAHALNSPTWQIDIEFLNHQRGESG